MSHLPPRVRVVASGKRLATTSASQRLDSGLLEPLRRECNNWRQPSWDTRLHSQWCSRKHRAGLRVSKFYSQPGAVRCNSNDRELRSQAKIKIIMILQFCERDSSLNIWVEAKYVSTTTSTCSHPSPIDLSLYCQLVRFIENIYYNI